MYSLVPHNSHHNSLSFPISIHRLVFLMEAHCVLCKVRTYSLYIKYIRFGLQYLLRLRCLQNKIHRTIGNIPRRIQICDLHVPFKIPHVHDFIIELRTQQAEVIQNHENETLRNIGQGEAEHRNCKRLGRGGI